jgi:hypothetical protein
MIASRDVIRFLRGLFGQQVGTDAQRGMNANFFVRSGYEYYANARFAMHAQSSYVCGNLFHHAIEMLLKADLAKNGNSLEELERMRHNLKRLWRAYKSNHPDAALSRHDRTINRLNRHEEIRYPDPALGSIGVSIEWSGEPGGVKAYGGMKSPKQYAVVVSDIDNLVADIMRSSSWDPGAFAGTNEATLEAIRRYNDHAEFLTSRKLKSPSANP